MHGLQACLFNYITVAAFLIYTQGGRDVAKRGGWRPCKKCHGNYIVHHGKSWKNHGIVFLNLCGILKSTSYGHFHIFSKPYDNDNN